MKRRVCEHCGGDFKTTGGLTRHLPHCNVSKYDFPRKKPRVSPSSPLPQSRPVWPATHNPREGEVSEKDSMEDDDIRPLVLDIDDVDTCVGTPAHQAPSTSPRHRSPWSGEREEPSNLPSVGIVRKGILSTSSRVRSGRDVQRGQWSSDRAGLPHRRCEHSSCSSTRKRLPKAGVIDSSATFDSNQYMTS